MNKNVFSGNSRDWFYSPFWSRDFRPLGIREHPTLTEAFRLKNPIVEEGGAKKFLLELDVRRFKPDEVNSAIVFFLPSTCR